MRVNVSNVMLVPEATSTLLSVTRLLPEMSFNFDEMCATVRSDGTVLPMTRTANGLFAFSVREPELALSVGAAMPSGELMHQRFGHASRYAVETAATRLNVAIRGVPQNASECSACVAGKQTRVPIVRDREKERAESLGEKVDMDIVGPMSPGGKLGERFYLSLYDEATMVISNSPMRQKSESLDAIKSYCLALSMHPRVLQSDQDTVFKASVFSKWCSDHNILQQFSAIYRPEQNGGAERCNRTGLDAARTMLKASGLPLSFWPHAVQAAAFVRNRTPRQALDGRTPREVAGFGDASEINELRVWGCRVTVSVPKAKRDGKFGDRAVEAIFLGWPAGIKGWIVYVPIHDDVIISRDVFFDESTPGSVVLARSAAAIDAGGEGNDLLSDIVDHEGDASLAPSSVSESLNEYSTIPFASTIPFDVDDGESGSSVIDQVSVAQSSITERVRVMEKHVIRVHNEEEPRNVREALSGPDSDHWREAMMAERSSMIEHCVFEPAPVDTDFSDKGVVDTKWVFKWKRNEAGQIVRAKARLVVRGFTQVPGRDFDKTYAPVIEATSVRIILVIAMQRRWGIFQVDVKTAYLNAPMKEELYVKTPRGFEDAFGDEVPVLLRIRRAIYGARQSALAWSDKLAETLEKMSLARSKIDPCVWFSTEIALGIFVDDIVISYANEAALNRVVQKLVEEYKIATDDDAAMFVGLIIEKHARGIHLNQKVFLQDLLDRVHASEIAPQRTPMNAGVQLSRLDEPALDNAGHRSYRSIVGSLMFAATMTRPDLSFAVGMLARHMHAPGNEHRRALFRVLAYVKSTLDYGIVIDAGADQVHFEAFADADHANCVYDRKSTSGFVLVLNGSPIAWKSEKQEIVAQGTAQAEYIALCVAVNRIEMVVPLLRELMPGFEPTPVSLWGDNQASLFWAHARTGKKPTKPVEIRYFAVKDAVEKKIVDVGYAKTNENLADFFTKALGSTLFTELREHLRIVARGSLE